MSARRSIEVSGLSHGTTPIPMGARVGPLICSSGISGTDPSTGVLPGDGRTQVELVFENLRAFLTAAGTGLGAIVRIGVLLQDALLRDAVNAQWIALFPEADDRPARHTTVRELPGDMLIQLEVIAYSERYDNR